MVGLNRNHWRVYKGLSEAEAEAAAALALDIQDYERLETNPTATKHELKCAANAFGIREDQIMNLSN